MKKEIIETAQALCLCLAFIFSPKSVSAIEVMAE